MRVINFFGGPGTGKSTTAAGVFCAMKHLKWNVELVTEFAKELTWEDRFNTLQDQLFVFAQQNRRLERLKSKVDWVVTDSPLILGNLYISDNYFNTYSALVNEVFDHYDNVNFLLNRVKEYNPVGRTQTEEEARVLDDASKVLLDERQLPYTIVDADVNAPQIIIRHLLQNH